MKLSEDARRNREVWTEAGESCPICAQIREHGAPPDAIAELSTAWVTNGYPQPPVPGYACVVHKRHVVEPYELDDVDGVAYWRDVMRAARVLAQATDARKLNYEIHGNTVEHLHTHLLPCDPVGKTDPEDLAETLRSALA
jgi:diadenosine tetraphosphate (Ap4A) HIT family hydrolase